MIITSDLIGIGLVLAYFVLYGLGILDFQFAIMGQILGIAVLILSKGD